jgi:hypothetical protein
VVATAALLLGGPRPASACGGDCNGDSEVTVDELVRGVAIALASTPLIECPGLDRNGDGAVTVDELLAAVNEALTGCPKSTATATPTATPPVPTPSPTPTENHPPALPAFGVLRTYPGREIEFPFAATDPDGSRLFYESASVPPGAQVDGLSGVLRWTPGEMQLGPFYVPLTVTDNGIPPLSAFGIVPVKVQPPDPCSEVTCDPATGCTTTPVLLATRCCSAEPTVRVAEPMAGCPAGAVLFVGRNRDEGFGRLQNCDRFQVINFAQTGAQVRFNVEARCVTPGSLVNVRARMRTAQRQLFEAVTQVIMRRRDDGFAQRLEIPFEVQASGPFFDFDDAEADLTVTLNDISGLTLTHSVRLVLGFERLPDLPDLPSPPPPSPPADGLR